MANLRVVYDNMADSGNGCVVTATSTAGTLVPANLQTDIKSEVWRSTSTTATLTLTWPTAKTINMVALPYFRLTTTATVRIRGFALPGDSSSVFDTGTVAAIPSDDGVPIARAFGYGGGQTVAKWFTGAAVRQVTILITDTSNSLGYIEGARVIAGNYWSPVYQCEVGAEAAVNDSSKHERTDAGDLRTDRGPQYRSLTFDLSYMTTTDRNTFWSIMRQNGMSKSVFVSLDPENASDQTGESILQIYGRLTKLAAIKYMLPTQFNSRMDIEEV